jgi:hypothetical protein
MRKIIAKPAPFVHWHAPKVAALVPDTVPVTPRTKVIYVTNGLPDWRIEARREAIEKCFPQPEYLWKETNPAVNSDMVLRERQRGVSELALSIGPEYMFTIRFEQQLSCGAIRSRLKRFGAVLDRRLLGRNWHKSNDRSVWIAVVEDRSHVHILLRPPKHRNLTQYTADYGVQGHLGAFWTSIVCRYRIGARAHVIRLHESWDELYAANYCAKQAWKKALWKSEYEFLILGSEFHSRRVQHVA